MPLILDVSHISFPQLPPRHCTRCSVSEATFRARNIKCVVVVNGGLQTFVSHRYSDWKFQNLRDAKIHKLLWASNMRTPLPNFIDLQRLSQCMWKRKHTPELNVDGYATGKCSHCKNLIERTKS